MRQVDLQYVTNQAGEKTAVILPISEYEELLEDLQDLAAVAERRQEPTISHEELLTELKRDGLIELNGSIIAVFRCVRRGVARATCSR